MKKIYFDSNMIGLKIMENLIEKGFILLGGNVYESPNGKKVAVERNAEKALKQKQQRRQPKKDHAAEIGDRYRGLTPETISKMSLKELENYIYISDGNEKLKSDKKTLFLIWNTPAAVTCPGKTPQCYAKCYARVAEKIYNNVRIRRRRNLAFTGHNFFTLLVIRWINIKLSNLKEGRKIVFRIHESGDFYSQTYTNKWLSIMKHFESDSRISFIAYTKSLWMFDGVELPKNFALLFSVWPDTPKEELDRAERMKVRIYTAFEDGDKRLDEYFVCRCYLCGGCLACENNKVKQIAAVIRN